MHPFEEGNVSIADRTGVGEWRLRGALPEAAGVGAPRGGASRGWRLWTWRYGGLPEAGGGGASLRLKAPQGRGCVPGGGWASSVCAPSWACVCRGPVRRQVSSTRVQGAWTGRALPTIAAQRQSPQTGLLLRSVGPGSCDGGRTAQGALVGRRPLCPLSSRQLAGTSS